MKISSQDMIQPASEIGQQVSSNLEIIGRAITDAAKNGHRFLALYEANFVPFGTCYRRKYSYSNNDLTRLKEMGYEITLARTEILYDGMWWWKKKIAEIEYHHVTW